MLQKSDWRMKMDALRVQLQDAFMSGDSEEEGRLNVEIRKLLAVREASEPKKRVRNSLTPKGTYAHGKHSNREGAASAQARCTTQVLA